ncbi:MAG: hypothetical protein U0W24_22100 [Bacteroidales bacterium]
MKKIYLFGLLIFNVFFVNAQQLANKSKLKRVDCFFGVHFDLHASEDIENAGKSLTEAMVDTFLTKVKPDFIQIDCKGHPGISSYPTKVGFHVKSFEKDPLKLFRAVTARNNVALFMHFSGVWDSKVVKEHPDWAVVNLNGKKSKDKTSFFSPYLETYMIPQLKELSDYGVDGAWIDGECWAVEPDYGKASLERFAKETGIKEVPKKQGDKYYPEFMEYNRKLFREHLKKYVDAIHNYNADFQITSNWSYSSMMPEKVNVDVDFLSGDVTPQNGAYRSAFEARCLAGQGKPWDLMAWGFSWNGSKMPMCIKPAIQLKQEAAEIMAMGGGVQFYFQQNDDLSIKPWIADMLADIGKFCRERQPYCHKSKPIPQIALLYPSTSYLKNAARPFANGTPQLEGMLNIMLDGQHPVEVLMEHQLVGNTSKYPLIVIPECESIDQTLLSELKQYLKDGGNLLVIGAETAGIFKDELSIQSFGETKESQAFISVDGKLGAIRSLLRIVALGENGSVLSNFYDGSDFSQKNKNISASMTEAGKGKIIAIYFDAGSCYLEYKTPIIRDFVNQFAEQLFSGEMVKVKGSHLVHVSVTALNGRTYVNLVNVAGDHANPKTIGFDEIPPLSNLCIEIKTGKKPSRLILQPEGRELDFIYDEGNVFLTIPELEIHSIVEIVP